MKLLIDTDPGHDDAMALMLACLSPQLNIQAITTVAGNSTIQNTTRNAAYVLELLGKEGIPIYSGASQPLVRPLVQAVVHGASGLEGIDPTGTPNLTNNAVDKILQIVGDNPGEVTIATLGPLTNVALAIQKDPQTMQRVKQIVMMGGAITVAGNKNRVAEFNIFVDPEAADIVMRFDVPKVLVPLDACNDIQLSLDDFAQVKNDVLREALVAMVKPYIAKLRSNEGADGALMYDPLTIFYLLEPAACTIQPMDIVVETRGTVTRGMTVADRRPTATQMPNVQVVSQIDGPAFIKCFITTLSRP